MENKDVVSLILAIQQERRARSGNCLTGVVGECRPRSRTRVSRDLWSVEQNEDAGHLEKKTRGSKGINQRRG